MLHEYTTLEGLQEDVIEVLLNLKDVAIRMHNLDETTLTLSKKGKGVVTAGDIKVDHNVEIINPDHVICHLTKDIALNMRLKIARGVGYQPATSRRRPDEEARPIGRLQLDASFCPVRRVAYEVDSARVEQRTDLDKLVLDIETNGAIDAEEAVRKAAEILQDQLTRFRRFHPPRKQRREGRQERRRSGPAAPDRRSGTDRAFGELPESREHLLHRRPRADAPKSSC